MAIGYITPPDVDPWRPTKTTNTSVFKLTDVNVTYIAPPQPPATESPYHVRALADGKPAPAQANIREVK